MGDFLTGIAFFLIIEGLVYALAPLLLVELAKRLPDIPEQQLRLFGLASIAVGVVLVWLVRG
ncbi:DUF2065 domain-containing protein [Pararhizobium sp. O133]|uniref:DUF2065 domain-containing protein n=1 Tax=Pararhizobium sp. O133 TaxID=3449278 RepID=UPI003F684691